MNAAARCLKKWCLAGAFALGLAAWSAGLRGEEAKAVSASAEPMATGVFQPSWESLQSQYQVPEWFRDAKFGIWAHWTAQCVPEQGDWYARNMYMPIAQNGKPSAQYLFHQKTYGHQSKFGFKDIDHIWKAEKFDPEKLIALYKAAGAKYFVALANHHDNFDCYDSKYQPWNSVNIGPKKDLVGMWEKAARSNGLRFGVTVHAGRAWSWFEPAQGSDPAGPMKGVPYDGKLTKADGKGQWWEGLDPQDLYAQNHKPGEKPDQAYVDKFYNRVIDLINKYKPDLLYFDDGVLPLRNTDAGLKIAAHYYNSSIKWHGKNEAVMNTKGLNAEQRKALVWDIERGLADRVEPFAWQTDTCIGGWHYSISTFERHRYKTADAVVHMLIDIVSKNGNLLLNIPVKGDGSIDADEVTFLQDMARWMKVNSEAIYATRPWAVYGEGPSTEQKEAGRFGGMSDTRKAPFTSADIRFTTKGSTLYAFAMAWPADGKLLIKSLAAGSARYPGQVGTVQLLGSEAKLATSRTADGLSVTLPAEKPSEHAYVLKITAGN